MTTTYSDVIHRKVRGTVTLSESSLTFHPTTTTTMPGEREDLVIPWSSVAKHQVSPANHPKCLLRILLQSPSSSSSAGAGGAGGSLAGGSSKAPSKSFELSDRSELDKIRMDVTARLSSASSSSRPKKSRPRSPEGNGNDNGNGPQAKRRRLETTKATAEGDEIVMMRQREENQKQMQQKQERQKQFHHLDPDSLAVARSSLLSSDPTLRAQHAHLVEETQTVSEQDFWSAPNHARAVQDEYARIVGKIRAGQSSSIRSNLDFGPRGRVRLGVEEMRQIFLLYPAVHRAYEEKVPLELSEEQFWRRYLESEFFHRDRGRIGSHAGRDAERLQQQQRQAVAAGDGNGDAAAAARDRAASAAKEDEAAARVAAAGANDLFLRVESEIREGGGGGGGGNGGSKRWGAVDGGGGGGGGERAATTPNTSSRLALGQFDLAATAFSDRGERVLAADDLYPKDSAGDDGGTTTSRVIDKYNRHWAMVLNSDVVAAGCDLGDVARRTAPDHVLNGATSDDAKVNGGVDEEMYRLVDFADAPEEAADHVHGVCDGKEDDDEEGGMFAELLLRNVGAYSGRFGSQSAAETGSPSVQSSIEAAKKRGTLSKLPALATKQMAARLMQKQNGGKDSEKMEDPFPPAALGKELLKKLTEKMSENSQAETNASLVTNNMRDEFRDNLNSYFRRSSELLRHFFGIRECMGASRSEAEVRKLSKIVKLMENIYREMETMRKELSQSESKMCLPIMEQLDWAFKLHRDDGKARGGGFVTVEDF